MMNAFPLTLIGLLAPMEDSEDRALPEVWYIRK